MSDGKSVRGPHSSRGIPVARRNRGGRLAINFRSFHEYLWVRTDDRNRIELEVDTIALDYGISYPTAHRALKSMLLEGRLARAGWKRNKLGIYVVADPATFRVSDRDTHARLNEKPVWG